MAVDEVVEQAVEQEPDAVPGEIGLASQRARGSTSNRSSLRTVINACLVMNAAISLVVELAGV